MDIFAIHNRVLDVIGELTKGVCGTVDLKPDGAQAQLNYLMEHADRARGWLESLESHMRATPWIDGKRHW